MVFSSSTTILNSHNHPSPLYIFQNKPHLLRQSSIHSLSPPTPSYLPTPKPLLSFKAFPAFPVLHFPSFIGYRGNCVFGHSRVSNLHSQLWANEGDGSIGLIADEDLGADSDVYNNTLRLVECSMFAAVAGLAYLLSNSLAIENYFGCFFSLPIVISSIRWGIAAGRKTMVATAMLLLVLSGPVKALTYLLLHGLVGLAMASLWRLGVHWGLSILLCSIVRALGAVGYVLLSSFLIRENILALITINIHASLTYILTAVGFNTILSMEAIYALFGTLVLLNCGSFVFLLHILYAVFLSKLGMKTSLTLPRWLQKAL